MRSSSHPAPFKRAQRFTRWMRLWLCALVGHCAVCLVNGARFTPRQLDRWGNALGTLAVVHVRERLEAKPFRNSGKHRHGRLNHSRVRALIGSRVRNALRGRDFCARLFAFLSFMRDLDRHVDRLERRLFKGLTRQRIIDPRACADACASCAGVAIVAADSS